MVRSGRRPAGVYLLVFVAIFAALPLGAASPWTATWITHPTAPLREAVVLHFRRELHVDSKPGRYIVHVSADNRFVLFVNGKRVGDGPARGDLAHWRYETFDLAPYLLAGDNLIGATVWNYGVYAPTAQITDRTAFVVEGDTAHEAAASTPEGWMVELERGQKPVPRTPDGLHAYMANGPGEELDAASYDWHWDEMPRNGGDWVAAASPMRENISGGAARAGLVGEQVDNYWQLVPDALPSMTYTPVEAGTVVRSDEPAALGFPALGVTIGAMQHVHVLLDRKTLTTAYPQLGVGGGRGSSIRLTYAEALYDKEYHKGDRDAVGDRQAFGFHDSFLPDGGAHRTFEPLWWRTWRYLDLDIQTASEPLVLESLRAQATTFPFEEKAFFKSGDAALAKIWEISWRTARLDAHETYMDTPYYEQLQYVGDTRIQALISYAVAGDDRLARQAIAAFDQSRIPEGLTQSRYPTAQPQIIPPFSLLWIGMVHDYWMYRPDPAPVLAALPGTRTVLAWFAQYEQPDGLLKRLPWWSFIDWVSSGELPTYDADGESCATTLEYLGALLDASAMEQALGGKSYAGEEARRAAHVRSGLLLKCWDPQRHLLADNPAHTSYSQQANSLAVLYDVAPAQEQAAVMKHIVELDPGTSKDGVLSASYYFRFYLARALEHAGMGESYLASLRPWRELLPLHFSTWPETPGDTRSDSHAWSAHPAYDLLTIVAGVEPASPGFRTVRITPHLGELEEITASYPHPQGMIEMHLHRKGALLVGEVVLPGTLEGTFAVGDKVQPLHAGRNEIGARR